MRHLLGRAVLPKGSLRLEVTEGLAMENPEKASAVLEQLSAAGAGLSLDDFATGYSSLSYLSQFSVDTIKVDRAFVQARTQNGTGSVVLRSIVALAHELGKKVVAEGVEAEDDASFLRSIGCEYAQGYYYGEAMGERDLVQLLKVVRRAERRLRRSTLFRQRVKQRDQGNDIEQVPAGDVHEEPAHRPMINGAGDAGAGLPPLPPGIIPSLPPSPAGGPPLARSIPRTDRPTGPPGPPPLPRTGPPPAPPAGAHPNGIALRLPPTPLQPGPPPEITPAAERTAPAPPFPPLPPIGANGREHGSQADRTLPPQPPPLMRPPVFAPPPLPGGPPPGNGRTPPPDFSRLPPAIRASLERLAGQISEDEPTGHPAAADPPAPVKPGPG